MHHVKRVRQSEAAIQAKKEREKSQIAEYLALTNDLLSRKKNCDWSRDAFDLSQRLLQVNPEFYTIWNYRRKIMLHGIFPESTAEEIHDLLTSELGMTTTALKAHPKVYWIWNHRRWCLENVPDGPSIDGQPSLQWRRANWDRELMVVEKMLDVDARNFHAWNYRRYVLASMTTPRPETFELAYTTRKISSSFSNFSAWHQRSKVYYILWNTGQSDPVQSREEEFELVHNALYTDPDDQSAWIYHRWLIGSGENIEQLRREITVIQELLEEQPDSKWCMDTLVYYNRMLLRKHVSDSEELKQRSLDLLHQLEVIDSTRRCRYQEIAQELQLSV
ncbi:rab-protein geranylgeranyltransferase [Phlebopus sp. FC_14]|nr:rab-protein geranylgeranyltransferase [Phlebopus sp. FC_14]